MATERGTSTRLSPSQPPMGGQDGKIQPPRPGTSPPSAPTLPHSPPLTTPTPLPAPLACTPERACRPARPCSCCFVGRCGGWRGRVTWPGGGGSSSTVRVRRGDAVPFDPLPSPGAWCRRCVEWSIRPCARVAWCCVGSVSGVTHRVGPVGPLRAAECCVKSPSEDVDAFGDERHACALLAGWSLDTSPLATTYRFALVGSAFVAGDPGRKPRAFSGPPMSGVSDGGTDCRLPRIRAAKR